MKLNESQLNKKWNMHKVIQEAVLTAHLEPSPETKERLAILETNQKNMMDKLIESIKDNKESHEGIINMIVGIEAKLDKALEGKANKWVERVLTWLGISIGGGLISYLGYLLIKLIEL